MMQALSDPSVKQLKEALKGWETHGRPLMSTTAGGEGKINSDKLHGNNVFMQLAAEFIKGKGGSIGTSPLTPFVRDLYKTFGFVEGSQASRLNVLWTLTVVGTPFLPRSGSKTMVDGVEVDDVIRKSRVAYTKKHDTINTDSRLEVLQGMLDNLVKKQSKSSKKDYRYERSDKELLEYQQLLEMDDEEFSEFLNDMHLMVLGIGPPESSE
jgi:hypothetical protein